MALVHRLPTELLIGIFSSLTQDFRTWRQYPDLDRHRFVLCAVCSRWRSIALSMNALWASISISKASSNADSYFQPLNVFKLYLERSGATVPLAVRFIQCLRPILMRTWEALGPHVHRIRSVAIIKSDDVISHLFPLTKVLQLTSLTFVDMDRSWTRQTSLTNVELFRDMGDAPKLRSLNMENVVWTALRNSPLHQLTTLKLLLSSSWIRPSIARYASWRDVLEIIRQCVSLVSLHTDGGVPADQSVLTEIIHLPQLRHLTTHNPALPSILKTPNLTFIHVFRRGVECDPPQPLPRLKVYVAEGSHVNWCIPQTFAAVEELHFKKCAHSAVKYFLQTLVKPDTSGDIYISSFPHLQTLSLSGMSATPWEDTRLIRLVLQVLDASPNMRFECTWGDLFIDGLTHEQYDQYAHRILPLSSSPEDSSSHEDQAMI